MVRSARRDTVAFVGFYMRPAATFAMEPQVNRQTWDTEEYQRKADERREELETKEAEVSSS